MGRNLQPLAPASQCNSTASLPVFFLSDLPLTHHCSQRPNSGLALRFPRITAIRRDKGPDDLDTLQSARSLLQKTETAS